MSRKMFTSLPLVLFLALSVLVGPWYATAQSGRREPTAYPKVQDLGNQRYRVGLIEVNTAQHRFTVPGIVLRHEPPLEFLAVTKGGYKAYESLFELGASAYEFNLACLLIGLDPDQGKAPRYHFDPAAAQGDAVDIRVSWEADGKTIKIDPADLIQYGKQALPRKQWVYTGSLFTPDGQYLAHLDGTLIGFVHDPSSVIEHRSGFGLNDFGAVRPNQARLPPIGTRVTLIVERRNK